MSEFGAFDALARAFCDAKRDCERWMALGIDAINASFLATLEWPR